MADMHSGVRSGIYQAQLSESFGAGHVNKAINSRGRLDIGLAQTISEATSNSDAEASSVLDTLVSYLPLQGPNPYGIGYSDPELILKALQILDHSLHNGSSHFETLVRQRRDAILDRLCAYESTLEPSLQDLRHEARAIRKLISDDGLQLDFERRHSHTTRWSARINQSPPTILRPSLIPTTSMRGDFDSSAPPRSYPAREPGKVIPQSSTGDGIVGRPNTWPAYQGPTSAAVDAATGSCNERDSVSAPGTPSRIDENSHKYRPLVRRSSSNEALRDGRPVKTSYIDGGQSSHESGQQAQHYSRPEEYEEENKITIDQSQPSSAQADELDEFTEYVKERCRNHVGVYWEFVRAIDRVRLSRAPLSTITPKIDRILVDFPDLRVGFKQLLARNSSKPGSRRRSTGPKHVAPMYIKREFGTTEPSQPLLAPIKDSGSSQSNSGYYARDSGSNSPPSPQQPTLRPGNNSRSPGSHPNPFLPGDDCVTHNTKPPNPHKPIINPDLYGRDRDSSPSPPPGYVQPLLVVRRRRFRRPELDDEGQKAADENSSGVAPKSSTLVAPSPYKLTQPRSDDTVIPRRPSPPERDQKTPTNTVDEGKTATATTVQTKHPQQHTAIKDRDIASLQQRRRRPVPDLVRDSWMETTFLEGDVVCHISFVSNPAARLRRIKKEHRWKRCGKLGAGTYGTVWLEQSQDPDSCVQLRAVKEIVKGGNASMEVNYNRELEAIAKFSHQNYVHCFVKSLGWYENDKAIFITMEYHEKGDLQKYLTRKFPELEARTITRQLLEGLSYMHDNGFAHRDLKPGNILVMDTSPIWWVKICDFGISKRAQEESTDFRTVAIGTRCYQAPEVCGIYSHDDCHSQEDDDSYSVSVDIWAVGAIAYYILTKEHAFESLQALGKYVTKRQSFPIQPLVQASASDSCKELLTKMMSASPASRPAAAEALNHLWVEEKPTSILPEDGISDNDPWALGPFDDIESTPSNTWPTMSAI